MSLGSRALTYGFSQGRADITPPRFPHSDILGSMPACGSPRLIAACHVLHRFPAPRHPPYALSSLTTNRTTSCGEHRLASLENLRIRLSKIRASIARTHRVLFTPGGGDDRIRTGDPLLAKQVLSQLSYIPACDTGGLPGIEPGTSRLSSARSSHLS